MLSEILQDFQESVPTEFLLEKPEQVTEYVMQLRKHFHDILDLNIFEKIQFWKEQGLFPSQYVALKMLGLTKKMKEYIENFSNSSIKEKFSQSADARKLTTEYEELRFQIKVLLAAVQFVFSAEDFQHIAQNRLQLSKEDMKVFIS